MASRRKPRKSRSKLKQEELEIIDLVENSEYAEDEEPVEYADENGYDGGSGYAETGEADVYVDGGYAENADSVAYADGGGYDEGSGYVEPAGVGADYAQTGEHESYSGHSDYDESASYENFADYGANNDAEEEFEELEEYEEPVEYGEPAEYEESAEYAETPETDSAEESGDDFQNKRKKGKRKKTAKKNAKNKVLPALGSIVVAAMIVALIAYLFVTGNAVKYELTVEAGDKCPAVSEFLKWKKLFTGDACFVSDITEETVFDTVGDYGVIVRVYGRNYATVVHVRDTVAPQVTTKNVSLFMDNAVAPEDFIESITDATQTTVRFKEEPDLTAEGSRQVVLEVEDEGGNVTETEASLEIIVDHEPPVISGVKEITITAGSSVSYKKGITVTDNFDENVELSVNVGEDVDTSKPGDYPITYSAVDSAGNETTVETTLHVKAVTEDTVNEDSINAEADKLLAKILDDSMSQYEKAKTIYWWCHDHIAYSDGAPKTDWVHGAYQGIVKRKGDCYTYAMTAKCLLTRAGITNMDIEKIRVGNSMHYWNLIDIGEGWHHFDTTRRADGSTFFYLTDEELMAYSDAHNGTHNYDRSLYPEIP
mgnify:FL=1